MRSSSFVGKFQVLAVKRLRNSYYGNPKWEVAIKRVDTKFYHPTYIATTQTNASCGYILGNSVNRFYEMTCYFSQKGNVIIETAREV